MFSLFVRDRTIIEDFIEILLLILRVGSLLYTSFVAFVFFSVWSVVNVLAIFLGLLLLNLCSLNLRIAGFLGILLTK